MTNLRRRTLALPTVPLVVAAVVGVQLLGSVAAQAATMHEYQLGTGDGYFAVAADPKTGDVFFGGLSSPGVDAVGRITPDGDVTWFPTGFGSEAFAGNGMAMHDGDAWFGVVNTAWMGYLHFEKDGSTTAGHFFVKDAVGSLWTPDPTSGPIYFTDGQYLGELDFSGPGDTSPTVSECSLIPFGVGAGSITGDPATGTLYFTTGDGIGKASDGISDGADCSGVETVSTPTPNASTNGIAIGGDGRIWFGEFSNQAVGAASASLTGIVEYPTGGNPTDVAAGPDGNVYVTDQEFSRILQVHPDGTFDSFFTVTGNADPTVITRGPDNAMWFPEIRGHAIGQLVVTLPTKTTIASSDNPATYGQDGDITATVKSVPPGSVPTGDVEFDVNGLPFETQPLNEHGKASMPIADLEAGSYSIVAKYLGDDDFSPSASKHLHQTVDPADTSVDLASSQNPAPKGTRITFTATVNPVPPGGGTPTGTITFKIDGTAQPPVTMKDGKAKLKTRALKKGSHTIVAVYSGSVDYLSSASPPFTQVIT